MRARLGGGNGPAEMELQITWHQWHDGRWEAWVTDESGQPPRLARDRAELEQLLTRAAGSARRRGRLGAKLNTS